MRVPSLAAAPLRQFLQRWNIEPVVALRGTPALVLALGAGLASAHAAAGAIVCGAALTVGFGVYQSFARSAFGPMAAAAFGMTLSTRHRRRAGARGAPEFRLAPQPRNRDRGGAARLSGPGLTTAVLC
jgi:hypothetical protein